MKTNNEYNRRKFQFKHEFSVNSNTIRAIFLRGIRKMHHHLNFIRHMSGIIYKIPANGTQTVFTKRVFILDFRSRNASAVSRMSAIRTILYSSLFVYAGRRDTEECQINTGWNISAVGFCDPGIYVPFEEWIFTCFLCCSDIFLRGAAGCCTDGTPIMFWNPVRQVFFFVINNKKGVTRNTTRNIYFSL